MSDNETAGVHVYRGVRPQVPTLTFAVFDEFGKCADDRVQDYAAACVVAATTELNAHWQANLDNLLAAERERVAALVEAVRDANRDAEDGDTFRLLKPGQETAWIALLAGLEGPNVAIKRLP